MSVQKSPVIYEGSRACIIFDSEQINRRGYQIQFLFELGKRKAGEILTKGILLVVDIINVDPNLLRIRLRNDLIPIFNSFICLNIGFFLTVAINNTDLEAFRGTVRTFSKSSNRRTLEQHHQREHCREKLVGFLHCDFPFFTIIWDNYVRVDRNGSF